MSADSLPLAYLPQPKKSGLPCYKGPGVYVITNTNSGKLYVGSAQSIRQRLLYHRSFLRRGKHSNEHLQRSWETHGETSFRFDVLEVCEADQIVDREQHWIDSLGTIDVSKGYNICPLAGFGAMRGRKHSAVSKAKMSEQRKGMDTSRATQAAAETNRGRKRGPFSEETKARMRAAAERRWADAEQRAKAKENHWSKRPDAAEITAKAAEFNRGRKHTEGHKAKIGASHWSNRSDAAEIAAKMVARVAPKNRGRKLSDEVRANMAKAQQARQAQAREQSGQRTLFEEDLPMYGTLVSVAPGHKSLAMTGKASGQIEYHDLAEHVTVTVNDQPADLGQLHKGDELHLSGQPATAIKATRPAQAVPPSPPSPPPPAARAVPPPAPKPAPYTRSPGKHS